MAEFIKVAKTTDLAPGEKMLVEMTPPKAAKAESKEADAI